MKNDLISRQEAIDVEGLDEQIRCEMCRNPMHTNRGCDGNCKYDEKLYERIMQILGERIKPLPFAEPRKKGKWDFMGWQMFQCSECKHMFTQDFLKSWKEYTYESHFPPFCPNCGAYMREGEEE